MERKQPIYQIPHSMHVRSTVSIKAVAISTAYFHRICCFGIMLNKCRFPIVGHVSYLQVDVPDLSIILLVLSDAKSSLLGQLTKQS